MAEYMDRATDALGRIEAAPLGHQESKRRLAFHEAGIYAQLAVAEQLAALVKLLGQSVEKLGAGPPSEVDFSRSELEVEVHGKVVGLGDVPWAGDEEE